jgi:hypothetical protein
MSLWPHRRRRCGHSVRLSLSPDDPMRGGHFSMIRDEPGTVRTRLHANHPAATGRPGYDPGDLSRLFRTRISNRFAPRDAWRPGVGVISS